MKSNWITYKEKKILYIDFSGFGLDKDGLMAEINAVNEIIIQQPEKSILGLTDMRETTISIDVIQLFKQSGVKISKYFVRQALVGMTGGFRNILYQAVSQKIGEEGKLFDSLDSAKDWLVGE